MPRENIPDFSQEFGAATRREDRAFGYRYRYPWWSPGDWITANGTGSYLTGNRSRVYHYVSIPDSSGWREPNPYVRAIELCDPGSLSVNYKSNGWEGPAGENTREFSNLGFDWGSLSEDTRLGPFWNSPSQTAYNMALTKCLNDLGKGKASIGLALAESHKTFKELAHLVKDIFRIYKAFKSLDGKLLYDIVNSGRSLPKGVANRYLQYQYGVKPLMRDIKEIYDFLPTVVSKHLLIRAEGKGNESWSSSNNVGFKAESTEYTKVVMYASVYNVGLLNLSRAGLLDIAGIAWELVPYSFLIDWLLPVGQVLSAYSSTTGLLFHSGTATRTVVSKAEQELRSGPITPSYFEYVDSPTSVRNASVKAIKTSRRVMTGFENPSIYVKSPFSMAHIANAAALIIGR